MGGNIGAAARSDGKVQIEIDNGPPRPVVLVLGPEQIGALCELVLTAAQKSAEVSGGAAEFRAGDKPPIHCRLDPTSLSLHTPDGHTQPGILLQMGRVHIGVSISDPRKLAESLLALSAMVKSS